MVGRVACCSTKLPRMAPAHRLYRSPLFLASVAYLKRHWIGPGGEWAILSAKHGLVMPTEVLAPYDLALRDLTGAEHAAWCRRTGDQVATRWPGMKFVVLAGKLYCGATENLEACYPLAGLGMGKRLQFLLSGKKERT